MKKSRFFVYIFISNLFLDNVFLFVYAFHACESKDGLCVIVKVNLFMKVLLLTKTSVAFSGIGTKKNY